MTFQTCRCTCDDNGRTLSRHCFRVAIFRRWAVWKLIFCENCIKTLLTAFCIIPLFLLYLTLLVWLQHVGASQTFRPPVTHTQGGGRGRKMHDEKRVSKKRSVSPWGQLYVSAVTPGPLFVSLPLSLWTLGSFQKTLASILFWKHCEESTIIFFPPSQGGGHLKATLFR